MTKLGELNPDFRDVLAALADAGAEFLIVGAYALAFHGAPRASGDVRPTLANAEKVFHALVEFGAPVQAAGLDVQALSTPGLVYQIGLPPRRIDVLTEISGVSFDDAWRGCTHTDVEGRVVPVIGRDDLLRNKQAAGRPKDLADVARLQKRKG